MAEKDRVDKINKQKELARAEWEKTKKELSDKQKASIANFEKDKMLLKKEKKLLPLKKRKMRFSTTVVPIFKVKAETR